MTIVECLQDSSQGKKSAGTRIPRGAELSTKGTVEGMACRFRTSYDVELWPFAVAEAEWRKPELMKWPPLSTGPVQALAAARIKLNCFPDVVLEGLPLKTIRFHLSGDVGVVFGLYEMFSANCIEVQLRDPRNRGRVISLRPEQHSHGGS